MAKVGLLDRQLIKNFKERISTVSTIFSLILIFVEIPVAIKGLAGLGFVLALAVGYGLLWRQANNLQSVDIDIEGSKVTIKAGDIFAESGLKVIAFNEYFDTVVDDRLISAQSLNGIFIGRHLPGTLMQLDQHIAGYPFDEDEFLGVNENRREGKKKRYRIGALCVYDDFVLAAFSKFDEKNRAVLTMPEYLGFLIEFWDRVNRVYAQQSIAVPVFGSGITRIKEHKNISDEDLLKIMLWTFRISEMRFKYPAKLTVVIHKDKIANINLLEIKAVRNGV